MATILPPSDYCDLLRCPQPGHGTLLCADAEAVCPDCGTAYAIDAGGILQLVQPQALNLVAAGELAGNRIELEPHVVKALMVAESSDLWQSYYVRSRRAATRCLAAYLDEINASVAFFLGVGTGREIEYLQRFRRFDTVYCSDLSYSALRTLPLRLENHDLRLGLFTSDLARCPIASRQVPVVIVRALHHTDDLHATLEGLLLERFEHILFEEPTENLIIRGLAQRGLAQRLEYSGVRPGRLNLGRLRALCRNHGYRVSVTTSWSLPEDYYQSLFGPGKRRQALVLGLVDALSALFNVIKLGNVSVVHLEYQDG